jgi:plastocyanin
MRNLKLLIFVILFFTNKIYPVTHPITSSNFAFAPASITIAAGDILSFTNSGGFHTVQWLTGPAGFTLPATSSQLTGTPITYTLTLAGSYTYQCGVHGTFMPGTITVTTALPIKLYSFMVEPNQHKGTKLKWVTASETDVDHFVLERTNEVLKFTEIARIPVYGNSTEEKSYTFNDENAKNGINYYRLKTVNLDKSLSYSPIIAITISSETKLNIFPNPSSEIISLTWNDMETHRFVLNIYDLNGKPIEKSIEINSKTHGPSFFDLNVSKYNSGKYFAVLSNSKGTKQHIPFIVNR